MRRGAPRHGAAGHDTARRPAIRQGTRATRRTVHLAGNRVAIQRFVSWLRGVTLGHDTTALRCDTAQQQATTRRRSCDTVRSDTHGGMATRRVARPVTRLATSLRYGALHATTRPRMASLGAVRAAWAHYARNHGPLGVHLCTQPSFRLCALFLSY